MDFSETEFKILSVFAQMSEPKIRFQQLAGAALGSTVRDEAIQSLVEKGILAEGSSSRELWLTEEGIKEVRRLYPEFP